jgi:RNA polymerase sigma-70 factor, ECF subfamily
MNESDTLAAARSGDEDAFRRLTDPYQRELLVHCYRMLGSMEDAEDILQETLLRAWWHLTSFERRSSLRSWLYKIATNAALDAIASRKRRLLPTDMYPPADPGAPLPPPVLETVFIEPLPDALVDERPWGDPEMRYDSHESVTLAFLAALQHLPGRQRAILILRDVLGYNARAAAEALDMSLASANSALQRARLTMKQQRGDRSGQVPAVASDNNIASLQSRYVAAWEAANPTALVDLLREDAVLTMPPLATWFRGRAAIHAFLDAHIFAGDAKGRFRLAATRANGCPAFAVYERVAGVHHVVALQVLLIENNQISEIDDFLTSDHKLFSRFDLPLSR